LFDGKLNLFGALLRVKNPCSFQNPGKNKKNIKEKQKCLLKIDFGFYVTKTNDHYKNLIFKFKFNHVKFKKKMVYQINIKPFKLYYNYEFKVKKCLV